MTIKVNSATVERIKSYQDAAQAQISEISRACNVRTSEILQAIVEATPGADPKREWKLEGSELKDGQDEGGKKK